MPETQTGLEKIDLTQPYKIYNQLNYLLYSSLTYNSFLATHNNNNNQGVFLIISYINDLFLSWKSICRALLVIGLGGLEGIPEIASMTA